MIPKDFVLTSEQQQVRRQRNLLLARATGGPPWLDRDEARAIIAVRLLTFRSGDAAVSAALCQRLAELLNLDLVPVPHPVHAGRWARARSCS